MYKTASPKSILDLLLIFQEPIKILLSSLSIGAFFYSPSSYAFTLGNSQLRTEFSTSPILSQESTVPILGFNQPFTPGSNYPIVNLPNRFNIQEKSGPTGPSSTLEDTWNTDLGNGHISTSATATRRSAQVQVNQFGGEALVNDKVDDDLAVVVTTSAQGSFTEPFPDDYTRIMLMRRLIASINTSAQDAWVMGFGIGRITSTGSAGPADFQFIFGFDGPEGRPDFIRDLINENKETNNSSRIGDNKFNFTFRSDNPIPDFLDRQDSVSITGGFTCIAFNGSCGEDTTPTGVGRDFHSTPAPEPLTIIGSLTALGFGIAMKKRLTYYQQNYNQPQ